MSLDDTYWRTLGERAVRAKGWRWMPGMRAVREWPTAPEVVRVHAPDEISDEWGQVDPDHVSDAMLPAWPDLRDPATLGCLLALVREAWGDPSLTPCPIDESVPLRWGLTDDGLAAPAMVWPDYAKQRDWRTEAEALVAALEAAP